MKNSFLIKPIISEKSMAEAAKNRYTFEVVKTANKAQIFEAVKAAFNVKPVSIKTIVVKGPIKVNRRTHSQVKLQNRKKAIIELSKDQKIDLFDIAEKGAHHHA